MRVVAFSLLMALPVCLLVACSGPDASPTELRLADLVRYAERYDGERVSTAGTVRSFADPEHYWIEDDDLNRIAVHPQSAVSSLKGERVRIEGRFRYSRDKGRSIEAQSTSVLPP